jgi:hypothetical protein
MQEQCQHVLLYKGLSRMVTTQPEPCEGLFAENRSVCLGQLAKKILSQPKNLRKGEELPRMI